MRRQFVYAIVCPICHDVFYLTARRLFELLDPDDTTAMFCSKECADIFVELDPDWMN